MKLIQTISELRAELDAFRKEGKTIGLVPTMGALHAGHASLVNRAVAENDVVVVSDFVNPTQFNDQNDLLKYPRTLEADCALLEKCGATLVFAPSVEEVYPEPDPRQFSYAPLDTVMEGKYRPGHFNGVCQIVSKLFLMVEPHRAYFGEKDFQQLAIIREMVRKYPFNIQIVGCPIVREEDGLALSSRNARLTAEQRKEALQISKALFASVDFSKSRVLLETKQFVEDCIRRAPGLELEYFEIVRLWVVVYFVSVLLPSRYLFSAILNLALRERGLRVTSSLPATITLLLTSLKGVCTLPKKSCSALPSMFPVFMIFFTMRSSKE